MYKILVVDDEKSIVKGIVKSLEQNLDLELKIYFAWTVSEALEIAKDVKIDLLCTDINMPILNGFELSEKVRKYWQNCKVIYLTGYDEFEYIYTAVSKYGGKYILKNEEEGKFIELIKCCIKEIERECNMKLVNNRVMVIEDQNKRYEKYLIIKDFLTKAPNKQELSRIKRVYQQQNIDVDKPTYLILGKLLLGGGLQVIDKNKVLDALIQIKETYKYFYELDEVELKDNLYLIIIQSKKDKDIKEKILINNVLEELQTILLEKYEIKISFIYSNELINFESLSEKIKLYQTLLNINILKNIPILININKMLEKNSQISDYKSNKVLEIDKMLMTGNFLDLKEIFESLYLSIKHTHELSLINNQMYYKCLEKVTHYIEKNINYLELTEELQWKYYHLRYLTGVDEIHDFLIIFLEYLGAGKLENSLSEEELLINKIEKYILTHITEEITLTKLAEIMYFNPSYLSRFYKNVKGHNLFEYIKEAKLIKAKELIRTSEKKIGDVSKELGYESVGYFSVFFKKSTGMTPLEYRNNARTHI
ncbi:MAG: response regulator [Cellulosilyticaceae bacterium]